jgi:hypothetical protein
MAERQPIPTWPEKLLAIRCFYLASGQQTASSRWFRYFGACAARMCIEFTAAQVMPVLGGGYEFI